MPRLLQINIVSNILSTGTIVEDISKVAIERGWETYVAYGRKELPGINRTIKVGGFINTVWHYIESRLFDNEGLSSRLATKRLINKIKLIKPDVIHLHVIHDHYLNYRILFNYLNSTNIKVVWTFHDFWAITGHCYYFVEANCDKWKSLCNRCPLQHCSSISSLIDRSKRNYLLKEKLFQYNKNLTIVPVSYWVGNLVKSSFLKDKRIIVIPNGIDINVYKETADFDLPSKANGRFVILGVAKTWGYGDRKGLDDYIKLSSLLKDDEIIILVGGMKEKVSKTLPDNIISLGKIADKKQLTSLYSCSDVLLSLSQAETFGLTIIEANACGTPVVVYDNSAPPSLITDKTGYVAKNGDIYDIYKKIRIIKEKGSDSYRDNCIQHVRANYDKNVNYQKYVDLYEELLLSNNH